jgi:hypothetical protein
MSREGVESLYCHNYLISLVRLDRQRKLLTRTDVKHREIWEWRDHTRLHDDLGPVWGYTSPGTQLTNLPNWYGLINSRLYLEFAINDIRPTIIRIPGNNSPIRSGPDLSYQQLGTISSQQMLMAFSEYNGWYQVYLASNYGLATGWIQGATDTFVPSIGISDPDPISRISGVNVRSEPTTSATVLTKVWDGQQFVMAGAPVSGPGCNSSWYKIHLHDGIGALYGWVCGQFVN